MESAAAAAANGAAAAAASNAPLASWTVPQVAAWLEGLHLPSEVVKEFQKNAVSGADLAQLSDVDMSSHLGLTPLQVRKLRSELTQLGVEASPSPHTPEEVPVPATAAEPAAYTAPPAAAPAAAPASRPDGGFRTEDLQRHAELQKRIAALEALQIPAKLAIAQQHVGSMQQQLMAAEMSLPTTRAALATEEKLVAKYAAGKGGCLCFCKGSIPGKLAEAEAQVARLKQQLQEQEGRASAAGAQLQEARSQLAAWQGQGAELEGARRALEALVERMFASSASPRQHELADALRALDGQASQAGSAAATYAQGTQKLQAAARGLEESLQALGRTQMLGAVNMGRGMAFQRRTGRGARGMPGRQTGNMVEMAVFRRANVGIQKAARDITEATALLGPGMPRVDPAALSSARAGMFQNILFGGVVSDVVQMAAVRRSIEQVKAMLSQVQACLLWAQQNLSAHQQQEAALRGQAAAKRGELEAFRRQALQAAVAANGTA